MKVNDDMRAEMSWIQGYVHKDVQTFYFKWGGGGNLACPKLLVVLTVAALSVTLVGDKIFSCCLKSDIFFKAKLFYIKAKLFYI